jgi:DNA-binding NarL/FixJ family response regulator
VNAYVEARCTNCKKDFQWLIGTPFVCPICKHRTYHDHQHPVGKLTPREVEIVGAIIEGKTTDCELSDALCITKRTVSNHLHHILRKLGVKNRTEAALRALRLGLINIKEDES